MDQRFYHTGQFAQLASVSLRTLRYYDRVGLLSPSSHTEAGYRLYTDEDFFRLQQILALKFLGFSLDEIQHCLQVGPMILQDTLALQKAMMQEQRERLDSVIQAIDETEKLLQANKHDWQALIRVIQVIQMTQNNAWHKKYFNDEQLQQMQELSNNAYSKEAKQKIAARAQQWTEEDQKVADQRWGAVFTEVKRLVATGQAPDSPAAQAMAQEWLGLVQEFTQNDPAITEGLKNYYKSLDQLPAERKPFTFPITVEENAFAQEAMKIYRQGQGK